MEYNVSFDSRTTTVSVINAHLVDAFIDEEHAELTDDMVNLILKKIAFSLIAGPCLSIYAWADSTGKLHVIKGYQYVKVLNDYMDGKYTMPEEVSVGAMPMFGYEMFAGKSFNELTPIHHHRIKETNFMLVVADEVNPDDEVGQNAIASLRMMAMPI